MTSARVAGFLERWALYRQRRTNDCRSVHFLGHLWISAVSILGQGRHAPMSLILAIPHQIPCLHLLTFECHSYSILFLPTNMGFFICAQIKAKSGIPNHKYQEAWKTRQFLLFQASVWRLLYNICLISYSSILINSQAVIPHSYKFLSNILYKRDGTFHNRLHNIGSHITCANYD